MEKTPAVRLPGKRLGKQVPRFDKRTFALHRYSLLTRSQIPHGCSWDVGIANWPMYLNDELGDCVAAAAGHDVLQWTTLAGKPYMPTDNEVLKFYESQGYTPGDPSTDSGMVMLDALNYWRQTGLGSHKISAFVSLNWMLQTQVMAGLFLFGNVYLGIQLPISAQSNIGRGQCWHVPPGGIFGGSGVPGSWGGHCVPIVQADQHGVTVVTWGDLQRMDWQFLRTYVDEAYCVLSEDWIKAQGIAPNAFNFEQLNADLNAL